MKNKAFFVLLFLICGVFLNIIVANPIVVHYYEVPKPSFFDFFLNVFFAFFITVFFEFLVGFVFLRNFIERKIELFTCYFLIHLITFPITQLIAYGLSYNFGSGEEIFLAELFPLVSEFLLLRIALNVLYKREILTKKPSNSKLFIIVFLANALTFIAGIFVWIKIYRPL